MNIAPVRCPSCGETFEVPLTPAGEVPCEVDYDCEICCRPMRLFFEERDGEVVVSARGLGD